MLEVHTIQLSHVAQRRAELRVIRRHHRPAHPRVTRDRIWCRLVVIFFSRIAVVSGRRALSADLPRTARDRTGRLLPLSKLRVSSLTSFSRIPPALPSPPCTPPSAPATRPRANPDQPRRVWLVGASALFRAASAAYAARTRALDTSSSRSRHLLPRAPPLGGGRARPRRLPRRLARRRRIRTRPTWPTRSTRPTTRAPWTDSPRHAAPASRDTARRFSRSLAPFAGQANEGTARLESLIRGRGPSSSSSCRPIESDRVANRDRPARLVRLTIAAARAAPPPSSQGSARGGPQRGSPRPGPVRGAGEASGEEDEDVDSEDDVSVPRAASFVVDAGRPRVNPRRAARVDPGGCLRRSRRRFPRRRFPYDRRRRVASRSSRVSPTPEPL